ncbi:MAG: hypothetical protein KGL39_11405 [Patescibacteria group bacterium]|nr:hypothetical protein [Patescibacteria group bacterium]
MGYLPYYEFEDEFGVPGAPPAKRKKAHYVWAAFKFAVVVTAFMVAVAAVGGFLAYTILLKVLGL